MKLLVFLAIIVLIVVCAYMAYAAVRAGARNAKSKGPKEWTLQLEETPDSSEFWLVKGENAEFIGRALRKNNDYSTKYLELEDEAAEKMYEWNAANRVTRNLNK